MVDDEPFCLDLYQQYLENLGQKEILQFSSGSDCLNQLTNRPDLIFLDYHMGEVNGLDTLRKIKRVNPNALVVFVSGQEDIAVAVSALKYGALDYIVKEQMTEERLRKVLDKAASLRQLIPASRKGSWIRKIFNVLGCTLLACLLLSCKTQNLFQTTGRQAGGDSIFRSVGSAFFHIATKLLTINQSVEHWLAVIRKMERE
ncbi:MAG: response regulator [Bacteroidetes bacterium]|nr:response regulator [Bacteroidota bacterium]